MFVHKLYYIIIIVSYLALASYSYENGFSSFIRTLHRYRQTLLSDGRIVKISSEIRPILIVYTHIIILTHHVQSAKRFPTSAVFSPHNATAVRRCVAI